MKAYKYFGKSNVVGERIKEARLKLGLSQSDLAARLQTNDINIEQKAISRLENGERFVADFELLTLSKILNVSVDWLLTGTDNPLSRIK